MSRLKEVYNALVNFEKIKNNGAYPVHKKLLPFIIDNKQYLDINDWLLELNIHPNNQIADMGCGVGYTLMKLCSRFKCTGTGYSISENETTYATHLAEENNMEHACTFICHSFDNSISGKFDYVIAIESIKHCTNLNNTITHIKNALKPGGKLILLDDWLLSHPENTKETAYLCKHWALQKLYTFDDIMLSLQESGLALTQTYNLTQWIRPINTITLNIKTGVFKLLAFLHKNQEKKNRYKIFAAGFILEKFFAKKNMSYQLLIASNNN